MTSRLRNRIRLARLRRGLAPTGAVPVIRLGSAYGGWVIPVDLVRRDSVVYSGGVGEDVSFDLDLIARTGCEVWAFDPTPRAIDFQRGLAENRFHLLPVGIWSSDESRRFFGPVDEHHVSHSTVAGERSDRYFDADCKRLATLMGQLGHTRIDLLKLDIEGAEYEVLSSLPRPQPACICVELHPVRRVDEIIDFVRGLDYEVVHVDGWNATLVLKDESTTHR
jgi:FkbM family methyltransferase